MNEQRCPGCGAANPAASRWCGQCYTPLAAMAAIAPAYSPPAYSAYSPPTEQPWVQGGQGQLTSPWAQPPPTPTGYWDRPPLPAARPAPRSPAMPIAVAGVVILLVALALGFVFLRKKGGVEMPAALGPYPRVESEAAEPMRNLIQQFARTQGVDKVYVEVYGSEAAPAVVLFVVTGAPEEVNENLFLSAFQQGVTSGASSIVDNVQSFERLVGSTTFACANLRASGQQVTLCGWAGSRLVAVLIGMPGLVEDEVVSLSAEAEAALAK